MYGHRLVRPLPLPSSQLTDATSRRQQALSRTSQPPQWLKFHEVLLSLQSEIDDGLPALQEEILNASLASLTSTQRATLLASRKRLVSLLASYDALAKRIKDLPTGHNGGAQDRLQRAIANRAALFLAERMGLLKGLGSFDDLPSTLGRASPEPRVGGSAKSAGKRNSKLIPTVDSLAEQAAVTERAERLAVLLECVAIDRLPFHLLTLFRTQAREAGRWLLAGSERQATARRLG